MNKKAQITEAKNKMSLLKKKIKLREDTIESYKKRAKNHDKRVQRQVDNLTTNHEKRIKLIRYAIKRKEKELKDLMSA